MQEKKQSSVAVDVVKCSSFDLRMLRFGHLQRQQTQLRTTSLCIGSTMHARVCTIVCKEHLGIVPPTEPPSGTASSGRQHNSGRCCRGKLFGILGMHRGMITGHLCILCFQYLRASYLPTHLPISHHPYCIMCTMGARERSHGVRSCSLFQAGNSGATGTGGDTESEVSRTAQQIAHPCLLYYGSVRGLFHVYSAVRHTFAYCLKKWLYGAACRVSQHVVCGCTVPVCVSQHVSQHTGDSIVL